MLPIAPSALVIGTMAPVTVDEIVPPSPPTAWALPPAPSAELVPAGLPTRTRVTACTPAA